ncbi:non-homologous end joining protein Ku [Variovorax guangxiensis]|uniref:Non-homologous end joining protein Ku n=1 Tax=Variovorax guangxiensis TaxID=1775474 RepID=A0A840FZE3_9BURK|nr:Ku protein [Variovorax guangxiensis]MBB4224840.1 DNA end-binding protein Ku [Variovorax guangxiensis]
MATPRSIASLSLGFGLVSIPVRLYTATESAAAVHFNLLSRQGERVKQQYVSAVNPKRVIPRAELVKGYEFDTDRFVVFQPDELKALEDGASHLIDIVAFIPADAVDPIYYDKPYFLAPDKRGGKPYNLLKKAMLQSGRCALAKWAWKSKQYVVQVRAQEEGLILQQLLYAQEVRSLKDLRIEQLEPSAAELKLALQLIQQISQDTYDPTLFEDEEKKRILAAIDAKIAGEEVVAAEHPEDAGSSGQIVDLTQMLKASLEKRPTAAHKPRTSPAKGAPTVVSLRKPAAKAKRAPPSTTKTLVPASRTRMKK